MGEVRVCFVNNEKYEIKGENSMSMYPAAMMKIMGAMNTFKNNHPKFMSFLSYVFAGGFPEGTVIEITVTKPGQDAVTSNMKVTQSDLDLFESMKDMAQN